MPHAEHSVTIRRRIDEVFDYLAEGTNNPRWREGVREIERTSTDGGEGATYRQVMKGPAGRSIRGDYRVIRHEPPRLLEFEVVEGPVRPTGRFELEPTDTEHTRVTFCLDVEPRGAARVLAPLVRKQMQAEVGALDELRRQLETQDD